MNFRNITKQNYKNSLKNYQEIHKIRNYGIGTFGKL